MAYLAVPSRADVLSGCRLRRCRVLGSPADRRRDVTPDLAAASACPRAGAVSGVRGAGIGVCGGVREHGCFGLAAGVCGLGGGHASVVSRRLPDRGLAHADCDCGTTPLGAARAHSARSGRGGGRHGLGGRPCPLSRVAELPTVLGSALSARNRLAERSFSRTSAWVAGRRVGLRAVAADLARPLPGQHDRRSRPGGAEHRTTVAGNAGVRVPTGRLGDQPRAGGRPRAATGCDSAPCCRGPTPT